MTRTDLKPAVDVLFSLYPKREDASIEDLAAAMGININAPYSAAEVVELAPLDDALEDAAHAAARRAAM